MDGDEPPDIGYIVCDPCFERDCANCIGLTHTRPFCGHRCGWLDALPEPKGDLYVEQPRD